jgi:hypothetical protein
MKKLLALLLLISVTANAAATFPTPVNLLGGTSAPTISIPAGDGTPTGDQGAPGKSRKLSNRPDGTVYIFGDSIIQASTEGAISPYGANYALGGQSLRRLINGLHSFDLTHAGAGVILSGVNDLGNTTYYGPRTNGQAVGTVLLMYGSHLKNWITGKWVIVELLPTVSTVSGAADYKAQIQAVNSGLPSALSGSAATTLICSTPAIMLDSNGYLKAQYALSDGQHLSKDGSAVLNAAIYDCLVTLGVQL